MKKKMLNEPLDGQITVEEFVPVKVCGFLQNVYRRDSRGVVVATTSPNHTQEKYISLEKKNLPNGYVEELVLKDYPINSVSVSSLAEGADYRNDPAQAIANAPKRVNLGDITEAQAFLENPQNFARVYDDVKSKLLEYYKAQGAAPAEGAADKSDSVPVGGVK